MSVPNYIYAIISVEIMSVLVCVVLLFGNLFEHHEKSRRNRLFSYTIIACIVALTADALSWVFDGREAFTALLYVCTVISLLMTFLINILFVFYFLEYTRERKTVSSLLSRIFMIFSAVVVVLIAATSGSGKIFYFENGIYHDGQYYTLYLLVNLLCSVFCLCTTVVNMRSLSLHDRIASMLYIIFPWIAGFINLFFEEFSFAYPAIVLSLVMLYVMIQSERQDKLEYERSVSSYQARHDIMTGLYNRFAYEERVTELALLSRFSGVVFTDVNGLKYTNDNFGHEEGDKLLKRYSDILCRCFRRNEIFRISGDEFVVLLGNVGEDVFENRIRTFRETISAEGMPVASIGVGYGINANINNIIKHAESDMYEDKKMFYIKYPEMKRQ